MEYTGHHLYDVARGTAAYAVTSRLGNTGTPIAAGVLYLEQNPDFSQLEAVGCTTPGNFYQVANHHAVASVLARRTKDIAGAQWALAKPELPEYLRGSAFARAVLEVQWEACQRQWTKWTTPRGNDPRVLSQWLREATTEAPVAGFVPYELVSEPEDVVFTFDGEPRTLQLLTLPEYRAPYTLVQWITYRGLLAGAVFNPSQDSSVPEQLLPGQVIIPASKLVLVSRNRVGNNFAGVSELRSVIRLADIDWALYEEEALGLERHATGDLIVSVKDGVSLGQAERGSIEDLIEARRDGRKTGGALLPPGVEAEVVSPQSQLPDFTNPIGRIEQNMMMTLGAEHRTMAAGGGPGSYAARQAAESESSRERDDDAAQFALEPLRAALSRMLQWSGLDFGGMLFIPNITSTPVNTRVSPEAQVKLLAEAVQQGLITWDAERDGRRLREVLSWT